MTNKGYMKLASIYIGTVIGAGFASGQEIMQFFAIYGYKGLFGILTATFLFAILGAVVLLRVYQRKIEGYEELIFPLFGHKLGRVIEVIITLFLFIGYCIMLAGSGAIFYQQLGSSYDLGVYIMTGTTLLTFIFSVKGISAANTIIVPLLLIGIITVGGVVILNEGLVFSNFNGAIVTKTGNWIISSILYVAFNSISAIVIMTSLLSIIPNQRAAIRGGVLGGIGLGVLALFILVPCLILYTDVNGVEIPMLSIAENLGKKGKIAYSCILWGAMFTTAIANGFGCIRRIAHGLRVNQTLVTLIFSIVTIPLAKVGFSNLVSTFYPLFGYLGFFMMIYILGGSLMRGKSKWGIFK